MARTFNTTLTISIAHGGETELDLAITYSVTPGTPERGRGYMADPAQYDPGSPDELTIEEYDTRLNGKYRHLPFWFEPILLGDETLRATILDEWREAEASAADDAAERRAEERREGL